MAIVVIGNLVVYFLVLRVISKVAKNALHACRNHIQRATHSESIFLYRMVPMDRLLFPVPIYGAFNPTARPPVCRRTADSACPTELLASFLSTDVLLKS